MTTKHKDKIQNERERIYQRVAWILSEYDFHSRELTKTQFIEKLKQLVENQ